MAYPPAALAYPLYVTQPTVPADRSSASTNLPSTKKKQIENRGIGYQCSLPSLEQPPRPHP